MSDAIKEAVSKEQLDCLEKWLGQGHAAPWRSDNKVYNLPGILRSALKALRPIASGTHVIVPVEPSSVMHEAGGQAAQWFDEQTAKKVVQRRSLWDTTYVAMISARDK